MNKYNNKTIVSGSLGKFNVNFDVAI